MAMRSAELFGVREEMASKLKAEGLGDSEKLLAAAATPKAREELAARLGVDSKEVLELANRADLARMIDDGRLGSSGSRSVEGGLAARHVAQRLGRAAHLFHQGLAGDHVGIGRLDLGMGNASGKNKTSNQNGAKVGQIGLPYRTSCK